MLIQKAFFQSKNSFFRLLGIVLLFTGMQANANSDLYVPPIGIPAPEFGINESHTMYADSQYDFGNGDEPYKDAGYGPYTHYVDNSVACNDSGNRYGTKDNPRCNLPNLRELVPGSVVEIHGGIYTSPKNWVTSSGTVDKPIFIRGYANPNWVIQDDINGNPVFVKTSIDPMPVIERVLRIRGAYIIIENIDFNKNDRREGAIDIRPANLTESVHHVAVRNSEIQNYAHAHGGAGSLMAASGFQDNFVHDIVYYKNNVHADNSYYDFNTDGDAVNQYQDDTMGIAIAARSNRVWIVDNHIHHNAGDAVGTGHDADYTSTNYYIGRNIMNDCDENAVDLKEVENYVVSQNIMYNFYGAGQGSNGTITVVHYGPDVAPKNTWFIYNEMYNASDAAVQVGGAVLDDVFYVGNVIHHISNDAGTAKAFVSWGSRNIYVVGNTVYSTDEGIEFNGGDAAQVFIENNIFSNLKTENYVSLSNTAYANRAVIKNNIFYSDVLTPVVEGDSINEINANPLFENPVANNFNLRNTPIPSPAIDSGIEADVYQIFQDRFDGMDIRVDFSGLARPQQGAWDIGAYEYTDSVLELVTHSLTNSQVGVIASYPIIVTGGVAPYTWSLSAGTLPDGLELDTVTGVIAGMPTVAGDYDFTLMVQDDVQASDSQMLSLIVDPEAVPGDEMAPVITLAGDNPQIIAIGNSYNELDASAADNIDGDISDKIVIDASAVKTDVVGIYEVTYNVKDAAGNAAQEKTRMVNVIAVVDTTPPVITLLGNNPQIIMLGNAYSELGATAMDDIKGNITAYITIDVSAVDIATKGAYEVTYSVSDGINTTKVMRIVNVIVADIADTTPPVITLKGDASLTMTVDSVYSELGASATDNFDGDISGKIVIDASALDSTMVGSYSVTYNVTDEAGNAALQVIRTVKVSAANNEKPVVTVTASSYGPLGLLMMSALLLVLRRRDKINQFMGTSK